MSASVLSRLLLVQGEPTKASQPIRPQSGASTLLAEHTRRQPKRSLKGPYTQSSEPILFPKLRIYFADFPYLHSSIDQRLLTLETWCGYGYDSAWYEYLPCIFKDRHGRTWQLIGWAALPVLQPYLWIIQFQGHKQLKRKDNSSRGSCRCLQAHLCCHMLSTADLRNINPIPFWQLRRTPYCIARTCPMP